MAETHQIEIKDGKVKVTVTGVKGQACKTGITARLQSLGTTITDCDTPEIHETDVQNVTASR